MEDKKYGNKQRGKQSFRSKRNDEPRSSESRFKRTSNSSDRRDGEGTEFSNKNSDRAGRSVSGEARENRSPRTSDRLESAHKKNKKPYRGKNKPTTQREEKRPSGLRVGKSVVREEKEEFSHKGTERSYKDRKRFQHRDKANRPERTFEKFEDRAEGEEGFQVKSKYSKKKQLEYNRLNGPADGMMRLNKFIANSGVCSRREADKLIADGQIMVNGITVTEVGTKVSMDDDVRLDGVRLMAEAKVYLLMNKPKDFVTTLDDPTGRKTVMDLIGDACEERIYPVGRLDRDTTGVLLFTNDGNLTKKLTHPSYERKKIYHVHLDRNITREELLKVVDGLELEDGFIKADEISYVDPKDKSQVGIEIHSGKNRIVRRIFEHLGYKVEKLDRVYFAGLTKKNLPRGKFRFLTQKEINILTHY